jgi:hypothetical protein
VPSFTWLLAIVLFFLPLAFELGNHHVENLSQHQIGEAEFLAENATAGPKLSLGGFEFESGFGCQSAPGAEAVLRKVPIYSCITVGT